MILSTYYFKSWAYEQALGWMQQAYDEVVDNAAQIKIAHGSHDQKIITLGRSYKHNELENYERIKNTKIIVTERGGGPTAHEPGQLVLYPVLNLITHKLSIKDLIYLVEQAMINFLACNNICAKRSKISHGIFVNNKKIGFVGMRIKNNVSYHGCAINIFNNAHIFKLFPPCNIANLPVTSLRYHTNLKYKISYYSKLLCANFMNLL
jgi:lipoyl(octanoyl) transferase